MKILFWYWGRTPPPFIYQVYEMIVKNFDVHTSFSKQLIQPSNLFVDKNKQININTYKNKISFLFSSLLLPYKAYIFIKYLRTNNIQVVISPMQHIWSGFVSAAFSLFNIKYICYAHDAQYHPGDGFRIFNFNMSWNYNNCTALIALTKSVRGQLLKTTRHTLEKITVIPLPNVEYESVKIPRNLSDYNKPVILVFIGRIRKYKGLNILFDAWPEIKKRIPNVKLEVWGEGDLMPYMKNISISDEIIVNNFQFNDSEIPSILRRATVFLLPYIEASQSAVIPITMSSAIPVVATPQPGLMEQLENGGGIISTETNANSYAEAVIKICTDDILYNKISSETINASKHYSFENIKSKTISTIRTLSV